LIGAPGRLEPVSRIGEVPVFVDYAHTPDALVRVLEALRPAVAPGGRLICIFGCGGDRDATKRGPMGLAVGRGADVAVVTNDNPRTEEPEAIARPILAALETLGVPTISRADLKNARRGTLALLDRAVAIEAAIGAAQPGDVVLIAGKGHEDYQILGTTKHPFDDRIVARAALDALR
jgi:UDP-N-acetylmuramoyl-L-alanyl-D-glutamate--2,6-diaminopimelate ligase